MPKHLFGTGLRRPRSTFSISVSNISMPERFSLRIRRSLWSISQANSLFTRQATLFVRIPKPEPISSMESVCFGSKASIILSKTAESTKKLCPSPFSGRILYLANKVFVSSKRFIF
ncbi:MAG: hypothetical protein AAB267_00920 [Candidatus Desantisbacteria bacterium]